MQDAVKVILGGAITLFVGCQRRLKPARSLPDSDLGSETLKFTDLDENQAEPIEKAH